MKQREPWDTSTVISLNDQENLIRYKIMFFPPKFMMMEMKIPVYIVMNMGNSVAQTRFLYCYDFSMAIAILKS